MGALGSAMDLLKQQVDLTRWGRLFQGTIGCTPNSIPMVLIGLI